MKKLLGVDVAGSAVLAPGVGGVGTVTFTGPTLTVNQILLVIDVTRNQIIYNFADASAGVSSFADNVLTLLFNTSSFSSGDVLQAFVDLPESTYPAPVEAGPQSMLSMMLQRILNLMMAPLGYSKDSQRYRATAAIESGTVTTVSTVSYLTNFNTLSSERLVLNQNMAAWAITHRARIS